MSSDEQTRLTPEQFIASHPLYVEIEMLGYHVPARISYICDGKCNKETTWSKFYDGYPTEGRYDLQLAGFQCVLCNESRLYVLYKNKQTSKVGANWLHSLQKVGQSPPLSVSIPKALVKNLGDDASALYRKSLICRNSGFGLGAVAYMRRVVENKTNELIDVAAELAESYGIDENLVGQIRKAGNSSVFTPYETKLQLASAVFPENLKVNGINPLGVLYELVSKAIHGLSENECIEIADETAEAFEFVFTNLRAISADRKSFAEKVTKWATTKGSDKKSLKPDIA